MEILPNVYHFKTPPFNWYVIEEGGRVTLIDAGFPGHYRAFVKGLETIGRGIKDVEAVLITHAHADHTGFAARVAREANAPVFIHREEIPKAKKILQLPWYGLISNAWRPFTAYMLATAAVNGVFTMPTIPKTFAFEDGEILDVPGKPHVLFMPGHTPGEVAFFLPERGVLFSGDALVTRNVFTGKPGEPQITSHLLNDNDQQTLRSLDRLKELGKATMLSGHGEPWAGEMAQAVEIARAQWQRK